MVEKGEFAEWAEVHGDFYGTPKKSLLPGDERGTPRRAGYRRPGGQADSGGGSRSAPSIYLTTIGGGLFSAASPGEDTEGEETLRRRLNTALQELEAAEAFDFFVINEDLEGAVREVRELARTGVPPSGRSLWECRGRPGNSGRDVEALLRARETSGSHIIRISHSMRVFTPDEVAESTHSKYLGVLVAARYARELNLLPRETLPLGQEKKLTTRSLEALTSGQIEFRLVKRRQARGVETRERPGPPTQAPLGGAAGGPGRHRWHRGL